MNPTAVSFPPKVHLLCEPCLWDVCVHFQSLHRLRSFRLPVFDASRCDLFCSDDSERTSAESKDWHEAYSQEVWTVDVLGGFETQTRGLEKLQNVFVCIHPPSCVQNVSSGVHRRRRRLWNAHHSARGRRVIAEYYAKTNGRNRHYCRHKLHRLAECHARCFI